VAIVGLVVMAVTAGLNGLAIKQLQPVFEEIFKVLGQADAAGQEASMARLWAASVLLFAAFAAAALGAGLASYLAAWSGQFLLRDVRRVLFERVERMPMVFFERQPAGALISRLSNDVQMLETTFSGELANLIIGPLSGAVFLGLMFHTSWRLSLLMMVAVPTILCITRLLAAGVRRHAERAQEKVARLSSRIHETIAGIRVVRAFGLEQAMADLFERENAGSLRERLRVSRLRGINRPASGMLSAAAIVAALVLGGGEIMAGRVDPAGLMTFLFLAVQAGNYIGKFAQELLTLQQAEGSALRVLELLNEPLEPPDPPDAVQLTHVRGKIEFDNVRFAYDPERPVLDGFSLTIEPGEHVAIVGPSGAGKTTVANLAARFYDPQSGAIRVDGTDLRAVARLSYRLHVAFVPQDTVLFAATAKQNIAFGRQDATDDEITQAAIAAGAHDFVTALPRGYDTEFTDLGHNLSGGQRQRIAIARAFLRRPQILILDEATSALDRESEVTVQRALAHLMAGRTSIIIAHRLSTIRDADRIVVLLEGKVVEEGTHEQLLMARGVYHRLYYAQAEEEAAEAVRPAGVSDPKGWNHRGS